MKLSQLKDVLAVANKRSFRAAARELQMTQPAMSRSVHELERELGVVLFDRHARGAVLTPLGERFVLRASTALAELQRAREEISQLQGESEGTVAACLSGGAQAKLLPYALAPFRKRYPGVQLRLFEGLYQMIEGGLRDGNIDFYIGPEPASGIDSGLVAEYLYLNPLVIVGRRDHPLSHAQSIDELRDAEWLGATMTRQVDNLNAVFLRHKLPPPRITMQCETTYALILSLAHSDLLALVPLPLAQFGALQGLTIINVREKMQGPQATLIRRSGMPLTPAAEYFCDMLRRSSNYSAEALPAMSTRTSGAHPAPRQV